ncbi:hypothetical protein KY284_010885 [Solanum tuberosum]|nr:hypothetical protein KY284_010885 [Solanum tuberosum]
MDLELSCEVHRYVLISIGDEQVKDFIMKHKILIDSNIRSNAWTRERSHSREFGNLFKEKVKNVEVPNQLRWLAKGLNRVATKRYTTYFINGYRFHTLKRDYSRKSQNSGVTLLATTDSSSSARDQNPIDREVIYYGAIQDIIEVDYYNCLSVVLFRCDWFHNEIDEYGLTRVYFNKSRSTDDPFVLASQVHQVIFVEDPIEKDVYYAWYKVSVDLYDLEEENCPNIGDTFWRELSEDIGPSDRLSDVHMRWSREDIHFNVVDMPSDAQFSEDTTMGTSEKEDDFDDIDWDWMDADD